MSMKLQVVTPHGPKVDQAVTRVTIPGLMGEMGLLPGHLPLMTGLGVGVLTYAGETGVEHLAVNGGFMEVADDVAIVASETAETPADIDTDRAEASKKKALAEIALHEDGSEDWHNAVARLARADNRLEVAKLVKAPVPA
jgi:F-type H+-transporting ATPase subunit epsilon